MQPVDLLRGVRLMLGKDIERDARGLETGELPLPETALGEECGDGARLVTVDDDGRRPRALAAATEADSGDGEADVRADEGGQICVWRVEVATLVRSHNPIADASVEAHTCHDR